MNFPRILPPGPTSRALPGARRDPAAVWAGANLPSYETSTLTAALRLIEALPHAHLPFACPARTALVQLRAELTRRKAPG